jgi:hypothetical protein
MCICFCICIYVLLAPCIPSQFTWHTHVRTHIQRVRVCVFEDTQCRLYTNTHTYTCTHAYMHDMIDGLFYMCMRAYGYAFYAHRKYTHTHTHTHTHTYFMHIHINFGIKHVSCSAVYSCRVYTHTYIHTHTHTHTHRQCFHTCSFHERAHNVTCSAVCFAAQVILVASNTGCMHIYHAPFEASPSAQHKRSSRQVTMLLQPSIYRVCLRSAAPTLNLFRFPLHIPGI